MSKPKVILLSGFAGVGKTTIARMYVNDHPLAMVIEGDELIVNIGSWLKHEDVARDLVFALIKSMVTTVIKTRHDVILPYLITNQAEATELEQIAHSCNADFYEVYLATGKDHAIQRLLKRGTWGEPGQPPITKADLPTIEELYIHMDKALQNRPKTIHIPIKEGDPETTYRELLKHIV